MKVRKHIQEITAADMHWRIKSFVHWKHEYINFSAWSWDMFPKNIWTENASLGSNLQ